MKQYRFRENDVTAVDAKTGLTTEGSASAPGSLFVPRGMKYITALIASHASNMAAATGYSAFVRVEGPGLVDGPQTMTIGAGGQGVATGGNAALRAVRIPVNFEVVEGQEVQLFAEMAGTDVGLVNVGLGLEFSDKPNEGETNHRTFTVEGDITAADARTALTTQGSASAPSNQVPAGYNRIDKIIVAGASEALADGAQGWMIRLGGNAVQGGEQVIPVGASGRIAPQSGSDSAPQIVSPFILENVDIAVNGGDTISVWAEGPGTDTGTGHVAVTLVYAK